jgi:hypothetical protein
VSLAASLSLLGACVFAALPASPAFAADTAVINGATTYQTITGTGLISGTPTTAGTYVVTVTATDGTGASGATSFTWAVGAAASCSVTYTPSTWSGGFVANVTIGNSGSSAVNGWTLAFTFPGDEKITNAWNTSYTQTGENVSLTNVSYNASIPAAGSTSVGFQGTWTSSSASPTAFTLNGTACTA